MDRSRDVAYGLINRFTDQIINPLITLVFAIAFLYFLWGVYKFFILDPDHVKEEGKNHMLYGIIGMVIMLSVYSLIHFLAGTFGIEDQLPSYLNNR